MLVGITGDVLELQHTGKLAWPAHSFVGPAVYLSPSLTGSPYTEVKPTAEGSVEKTMMKVVDSSAVEVIDYPAFEVTSFGVGTSGDIVNIDGGAANSVYGGLPTVDGGGA